MVWNSINSIQIRFILRYTLKSEQSKWRWVFRNFFFVTSVPLFFLSSVIIFYVLCLSWNICFLINATIGSVLCVDSRNLLFISTFWWWNGCFLCEYVFNFIENWSNLKATVHYYLFHVRISYTLTYIGQCS